MELNRAVAENIKRIRKSKKMSMEKTAAEAGVSRSMLGQIERGEANPSVAILGKIAAALKVPAEILLENDDFEPSVPGCVCHATLISGTVRLHAEDQEFTLMERDALRFAADRPYRLENATNSTARLVLMYQYLK